MSSDAAAAAAAAASVTHMSCPPPYLAESAVRSHVALAALVAKAKLYAAARKNRFARSIDAPVAFLDLSGGRCGGALRTVEALKVGTDPTADAGLGAGLIPIIRLTYGALRAAWSRTKALSNLGLVIHGVYVGGGVVGVAPSSRVL